MSAFTTTRRLAMLASTVLAIGVLTVPSAHAAELSIAIDESTVETETGAFVISATAAVGEDVAFPASITLAVFKGSGGCTGDALSTSDPIEIEQPAPGVGFDGALYTLKLKDPDDGTYSFQAVLNEAGADPQAACTEEDITVLNTVTPSEPTEVTDTESNPPVTPDNARTCGNEPADIIGTDGPDALVGTSGDDVIHLGAGDDIVSGRGGRDLICGGGGADVLSGGGGIDLLIGGRGDDELNGGGGSDILAGQRGDDELRGGGATDDLLGGSGGDDLHGGRGSDGLSGGSGDDDLRGGPGADRFAGGKGDDVGTGGPGRDVFVRGIERGTD